ncbi:MAG: M20 family metallopeptidase [Geminicoccaceae bacterium]|nr:M20 family metallopeptidase [Geminicoccaceae bacterium]
MTGTRAGAIERAKAHFDSGAFEDDLARRVAYRTESQEPDRLPDCRRYLTDEIAPWLEKIGYRCGLHGNPDGRTGPFLVAERHEGDDLPTLLTYGHGDVVRGIEEQWRDGLDPWAITVEGDRWYGRGTADNKGQHSIIMAALAQVAAERGRHGFNSKLLIETGEEVGSPGLDAFCAANRELLAADVLIGSDGPRMKADTADVVLGNRGGIAFDLVVHLREGSVHSGHWGGVLEDPGIILAHALASITDARGRILVEDWLPKDVPPAVKEALRRLEVDPGDASMTIPVDWGEPGLSLPEKVFGWTSFIVLAFLCGRPENPVNGVQPNARARCQIRFTADVDRADLLPALRRHLDGRGFEKVAIEPAERGVFPAWRTDPDDPWVDWTRASVERTTGKPPALVPNQSGGLPSELFHRNLGMPVIWIPHSYGGCKQHGPDEHLLASVAREGLAIMTGLFWDLGESPPRSG